MIMSTDQSSSQATHDKSHSGDYRICAKTIMDTSDPLITFDDQGVCNHFHEYVRQEQRHVLKGAEGANKLTEITQQIKAHGRRSKYDCILGLSGGVDSTYLCLLAKEIGLRPLVVHFDNGWNSELAVHNIENTVQRLGFDLYTYVCDWPEFRELQRSYFKANVVDIEVLTDHGFMAVLYQQARKHRIKYVLGGMNIVTEAILPKSWIYDKSDLANLTAIQAVNGEKPIKQFKSYPMLSPARRRFYDRILGFEVVTPLNFVDYRYDDVKAKIIDELDWRDYGGKHYESVFTRFYQGFILPNKFGFDKRRAHLSTLICSGQMTRDQAMKIISEPGYDADQVKVDRPFVLKKLGFSEQEFDDYIAAPSCDHQKFGTGTTLYSAYPLLRPLRPIINALFPDS
jgi:N-acetyl sugar amidotransferase